MIVLVPRIRDRVAAVATRKTKSGTKPDSAAAEAQLTSFLEKFTPEIAKQAVFILRKMRALLPGAVELVYDNYNALAIGFGPNERTSDCVFSIAVYPRWVSLFFLHAVGLRDPQKLLKGGGNVVRHIVLTDV